MKSDRSFSRPISPTSSGARSFTTPRALARSSTASPSTATRSTSTPSRGATRTPSIARGTRRSRLPTRPDPHPPEASTATKGSPRARPEPDPISTDQCDPLQRFDVHHRRLRRSRLCVMPRGIRRSRVPRPYATGLHPVECRPHRVGRSNASSRKCGGAARGKRKLSTNTDDIGLVLCLCRAVDRAAHATYRVAGIALHYQYAIGIRNARLIAV